MKHLDDFTLNEYLDHALDERARRAAAAHLGGCPACRAKLDAFQSVFTELDALPETHLEHDLAPAILARLPRKTPVRIWTRTFAAQVGAAIGMLFWLMMQAIQRVKFPQLSLPKLPTLDVQTLSVRILSFQFPIPDLRLPALNYQLPAINFQIPTFNLQPSTTHIVALCISALLLWVTGNVVLLRSRQEAR